MKFSIIALSTFATLAVYAAPVAEANPNAIAEPEAIADPHFWKKKGSKFSSWFPYYRPTVPPGGSSNGGNVNSNSSANSGGSSSSANSGGNGPVSSNSEGNTVNINLPPGSTVTNDNGHIIITEGGKGGQGSSSSSNSGSGANNANDNDNGNTSNSGNNNTNGNDNSNSNQNHVNTSIYIIPGSGYLTGGAVFPGSIPFEAFLKNGTLFTQGPNNQIGQVAINNNGQLQVVNSPHEIQKGWLVQNGTLSPNGQNIMLCPDAAGVNYLYSGIECPQGAKVDLTTSIDPSAEQKSTSSTEQKSEEHSAKQKKD